MLWLQSSRALPLPDRHALIRRTHQGTERASIFSRLQSTELPWPNAGIIRDGAMKRLIAVVLAGVLAACSSASAPLGGFTGTWVGSPDGGVATYTIHAVQKDSVVSGSGTLVSGSTSDSYTVSGISTPPNLVLTLTLTGGGEMFYDGTFVTPDSVSGVFPGSIGGFSNGSPDEPMSLKRQ
jgi:hypothetical protein